MRLAKTLLEVGLKQTQYNSSRYTEYNYYTQYITSEEYYTYYNGTVYTQFITTYPNDPGQPEGPPGNIGGWAGGWYVYTGTFTTTPTSHLTSVDYYTEEYGTTGQYTNVPVWRYTTW